MKIISLGGAENNVLGCLHETKNVTGRSTGGGLRVCVGGLRQFVEHDASINQRGASSSFDQRAEIRRQVVGRVDRQFKIKPGGGFARSLHVRAWRGVRLGEFTLGILSRHAMIAA